MSLHCRVKFRTIIVISLLQKYDNNFFIKKYRHQTKTAKLTDLLSVFFTTFSFCVIFIVEVYTLLIKVYCFLWGEKWVAQKTVSCWIAWKMVSQTTSQVLFEMTIVFLNTSFESSNLVRHWSMASSTTLCWNSRHVSTIRCRNSTFLHFTRESGDIVEVKWAYLGRLSLSSFRGR